MAVREAAREAEVREAETVAAAMAVASAVETAGVVNTAVAMEAAVTVAATAEDWAGEERAEVEKVEAGGGELGWWGVGPQQAVRQRITRKRIRGIARHQNALGRAAVHRLDA